MYPKRPATTLFRVAVIPAILWMVGCHEVTTFRTLDSFREIPTRPAPKVETTTIHIDSGCEASPDEAGVSPGEFVEFCNESGCPVSITFEERALFARDDLTLAIDECVKLRVMSDTERTSGYLYHIYCECEMMGHSTPQIIVSPPPPPSP